MEIINNTKTKKNMLKAKAFFLIFLVFIIPFYVGDVYAIGSSEFAGVIQSIQVYDDLQVHQVLKPESQTINVVTRIRDKNITPETVFVNGIAFEVCEDKGLVTECSTNIPVSLSEGSINVQIEFESVTQSVPVVIDSTAPTVTSFKIDQEFVTPNQQVPATVTIQDRAQNTQFCSGVKTLQVATDQQFANLVFQKEYEHKGIQSCTTHEVVFFNFTSEEQGELMLYARAIDHANNKQLSNYANTRITYDTSAPIVTKHVIIFNGQEVKTLPRGEHEITIAATIKEDIELVEAELNLSGFTVGSQLGSCSDQGNDTYICSWTGTLAAFSDEVLKGTVTSVDSADNEGTYDFTFGVVVDDQGPIISDIRTENDVLLGTGDMQNKILARITDEKSDVNFQSVYANLKNLNYGANTPPTRCTDNVCEWSNLTIARSGGPVTIQIYAEDVIGFSSTKTAELFVDTQGPIITAVEQNTPTPSIEDPLIFYVKYIEQHGIVKAEADVSRISSQKIISGSCGAELEIPDDTVSLNDTTENESLTIPADTTTDIPSTTGGESICIFEVPGLKNEAILAPVMFTLTDTIGNIGTYKRDVQIFQIEGEVGPDVVSLSVGTPRPPQIDRNLASRIPLKVFVPLHIETADDTRIFEKQLICEGGTEHLYTGGGGGGDNPYLLGADLNDPFLIFTVHLTKAAVLLDEITFDCQMSMLVRSGGIIYKQPEVEDMSVTIPLFNVPIGDLDQATIDKLEDIKDLAESKWFSVAETIDKIFTVVRKICNIMNVINKVYSIVQAVKPIILAVSVAANTNGIWKAFLWVECGVKAIKDFLWPNDSKYYYDFEKGGFWSLIGGKAPDTEATEGGWGSVGGIARRACAFTECSQCNRGFGITGWAQEANQWMVDKSVGKEGLMPLGISSGGTKRLGESDEEAQKRLADENSKLNLGLLKDVDLSVHMDPFNSWAVAVGCLCLPGIIHNALKYRDLQCIHAKCITDNARYGFSTAPCDIEHGVRTCEFWLGGLFRLLPGYTLFKVIMRNIVAFARELPARLALSLKNYLCRPVTRIIEDKTPKGTTFAECKKDIPLNTAVPLSAHAGRSIACGTVDLAMLIYAWEEFIGNAFDFENLFDFSDDRGDLCEDAFKALEDDEEDQEVDVSNQATVQSTNIPKEEETETSTSTKQEENKDQKITIG